MTKSTLLSRWIAMFTFSCGCLLLCLKLAGQEKEATQQHTNIVLIMADDLGYECLGAYGGTSYKTPQLDQLAETGMRFDHCYSQPLCTPSRVQIMTGIYNVRNYTNFGVLPKDSVTFAQLLKDAGYKTCVAGKWQLKGNPTQFGFDEHCLWQMNRVPERYPNPGLEINGKQIDFTNGEYGPDLVSDYACQFIRKNKFEPFLVYYPMILTHCPFCPTPDSADWDPTNTRSKTYKGDAKYFGDMVTYMDKIVGKLVTELEEQGLRENTLVIFTGDNGTDKPVVSMMGETSIAGGKKKMTDAGTHVALIANWPGTIKPASTNTNLIDFSDFMPTICEIANCEKSDRPCDGVSFLEQLRGQTGTPREWIYCWFARNGGANGQQWTRNQKYKLYRNGKMYDVANDVLEKSPLRAGKLSDEQRKTFAMLQAALDQFQNARPDEVSEKGQQKKR